MTVIINDFEVVTEPPSAQEQDGGAEAEEGQSAQSQGPTPHELEHIAERQRERRARLWAH